MCRCGLVNARVFRKISFNGSDRSAYPDEKNQKYSQVVTELRIEEKPKFEKILQISRFDYRFF